MYITNPGTMRYMYIHTDEQTAVVVIADDKRSSSDKAYIFPSWHDYKT